MNGNRYFAEAMKAYGVSHLFFVPTMLIPAMAEMEEMDIGRIVAHGEKAAAYMADGYARASHRVGICLSQDIGSTNLAAGLRDAYMGNSPVIAITGGQEHAYRYRHAYQNTEDSAAWDGVTKANYHLDTVQRLPDILRQAFRVATTGTPGPVHIETRGNHGQVLEEEADLTPWFEERFSSYPPFRPEPEPSAVRDALRVLSEASRPVIVAGGGLTASGAGEELIRFAELLQIPVATALNAKELMPDDHPLNLGVPGTYSRWCANRAVSEADLVFFIGSHTGGQATHFWAVPKPGVDTIQLDINPEELGLNYPNKVSLLGDAKVTLQRLIAEAKPGASRTEWLNRVQGYVRDFWAESEAFCSSDATPMRPERICREISEWLPAGGTVVSDTGHAGMWTGQMVRLRKGQHYIRCAGSLGWGFPGSLGVKTAMGDAPVVCFSGDGGFYYHIGELETAVRNGINAIMVVNNNFALNQEHHLFEDAWRGKESGNFRNEMWIFRSEANLAKVAEDMGAFGIRVENPADIKGALDKAQASGRPAVVEVLSDVEAMSKRAWVPSMAAAAH